MIEIDRSQLPHDPFKKPADKDAKIWRYLDFCKFDSLLSRGKLYLRRLDLLPDQFEGRLTPSERNHWYVCLQYFGLLDQLNPDDLIKRQREAAYVNCWNIDNFESAKMWKNFCADSNGVVIQSSYKKLALYENHKAFYYLGMVEYIDFSNYNPTPELNLFSILMHKNANDFAHENELRLLKICNFKENNKDEAALLEIDLDQVIENIYVHPDADQKFFDKIRAFTSKYLRDVEPQWSVFKK